MSSEIERLADQVRELASQDSGVRAVLNTATRVAREDLAAVAGSRDCGGLAAALQQAGQAARAGAQSAEAFGAQAQAFADFLASGGGSGPISGPGGSATDAHGRESLPASQRTMEEIDAALTSINPNYNPFDPRFSAYQTNCGNTSANLFDFLNGEDTSQATTGTLTIREMEARTGMRQVGKSPAEIESMLRSNGPGSHCVVGVDRRTGAGHWFNAYFDGESVWGLDAQSHRRFRWPPDEPNAKYWDASVK